MAETNSASDHSLLWGYAVEFWDRVGIWALIIGAIVGVVALVLTAASAYILYRVADAAQAELASETKRSSERIAGLNSETARLQAENLEVQKIMLPRRLLVIRPNGPRWKPVWLNGTTPAKDIFFEEFQSLSRTEVWIQVFPDFEAQTLADDLVAVLAQVGWRPRIVSERDTGVSSLLIPEGLRVFTLRNDTGPVDGAAMDVLMNLPINKAASALETAMRRTGIGSPYLGVQFNLGVNNILYLQSGFPYFVGVIPDAIFLQVGVKPRALELLLLQSK